MDYSGIQEEARLASGWVQVGGEWRKPCPSCKQMLPATSEFFYLRKNGAPQSRCKPCANKQTSRITRDTKKTLIAAKEGLIAQNKELTERNIQLVSANTAFLKELNQIRSKEMHATAQVARLQREIQSMLINGERRVR